MAISVLALSVVQCSEYDQQFRVINIFMCTVNGTRWAALILMEIFQNGTGEMNHTTDGFLSSILNDEDLQLMDMAMNEGESGEWRR